jgi:hypothetical protein
MGMKKWNPIVLGVFSVIIAAGCASTKTISQSPRTTERLPRPENIWIYDFAATPADMPADSALAGQYTETPQTAEQIATGRKLGALIAKELVAEIRSWRLPAAAASAATKPRPNDIVLRGYLISVDKGSAAGRVAIGFGAGGSELQTVIEGYQMTAQGLRRLGSGTLEAKGSKTPGAGLGAVGLLVTGNPLGLIISGGMKAYGEVSGSSSVEGRAKDTAKAIAAELKKRAQAQGWIK